MAVRDRHLRSGTLHAYVDGALSAPERERVREHLAGCPACQTRLDDARRQVAAVDAALAGLAPPAGDRPATEQALSRLRAGLRTEGNLSGGPMIANNGLSRNWKRALSGVTAVAVLAGLLAFPPVRAAARELLAVFRMEEITVLPVSSRQLESLEALEGKLGSDFFPGEMDVVGDPDDSQRVDSLDAAAGLVPYPIRTLAGQPAPDEVIVRDGIEMQITPSVELMRVMFEAADLSPDLVPESLDGQTFDISVDQSVVQLWNAEDDALMLTQMPGPSVTFSEAVDEQALAYAMLQLVGFSADDAAHLSQSINWRTTLVMPIPSDQIDYEPVTINGSEGFLLEGEAPAGESNEAYAGVMWQTGDMVYFLSGSQDGARLVEIAQTLQ